jgi:hypothetical protein
VPVELGQGDEKGSERTVLAAEEILEEEGQIACSVHE